MKLNVAKPFTEKTHEGAPAARTNAEQQLRRSVMACLLWEDTFYEEGVEIAKRIADLISKVDPERVANIAREARTKQKLRHVPLLIAREMARLPNHKLQVGRLLPDIIQRPDELTEFLAIYWKDGKQPLSAQVKKGLARAFPKFNEYSLAKYNSDGAVKLRDVLFLSHASPQNVDGTRFDMIERTYVDKKTGKVTYKKLARHIGSLFDKVVNNTLATPDTWEVALSGGADKKETFTRLMEEEKLFALAFLRNLRNMKEAGVDPAIVRDYATKVKLDRVLPFRFIAAASAVPEWEPMIEQMMLRSLEGSEKLLGKTAIVIDNSGSMVGTKVSKKSELDRRDAACALAILVRELCEDVVVVVFSDNAKIIPARRGFALRDLVRSCHSGGTYTQLGLDTAQKAGYNRIIVITDEQSHQTISGPIPGTKGYFINVSTNKNGIGYGPWTHIDGWSEAVIDYIRAAESME